MSSVTLLNGAVRKLAQRVWTAGVLAGSAGDAGEGAGGPYCVGVRLHQRPNPLHKPPRAFDAGGGPLHIALGRRIGEHKPARHIGAEIGNERIEIDDVLFGLRHFFDGADFDGDVGAA